MDIPGGLNGLGVAALAAWFVASISLANAAPTYGLTPEARQKLVHLVRQDCGSCHGLQLKGGLGPALTPDALTGKPADSLVQTVLKGRPGTAMPGWQAFLSEDEARWIIDALQADFPQEDKAP